MGGFQALQFLVGDEITRGCRSWLSLTAYASAYPGRVLCSDQAVFHQLFQYFLQAEPVARTIGRYRQFCQRASGKGGVDISFHKLSPLPIGVGAQQSLCR